MYFLFPNVFYISFFYMSFICHLFISFLYIFFHILFICFFFVYFSYISFLHIIFLYIIIFICLFLIWQHNFIRQSHCLFIEISKITKASIWLSGKILHYIYISTSTLFRQLYHIKYHKIYKLWKVVTLLL